ncbi:Mce protein [Mycobacterium sp. CVI_P3]|uniref:Mce protein n=1 Tax=Mycobacterium pinniadriaticum TaxID=2994102 RepID=A0ABT3SMN0_9MYCO|nr:Mce protein [Mycobacterium pinniadriaticum]MCX2934368.1 Mce protein [Mycobacterium pinniadriaticum]MCX2940791.1 Mce protein [Mycobacterium pinniadriaticum]
MEDQQPSAGDLTDAVPEDEATAGEATEQDEIDNAAEEPAPTRNWLSRHKATIGIGTSAVLFVAAGAFAGATVQPYLMDRAAVDTKLDIARTAAEAITTLWTYTPDDMDALPDRSAKYLSGDFEDQYRKYVDAIAPTNKQAKVTNSTEVVGAAVESLSGSDATAIVYTNTTSTSPLSKNIPAMRYLSYRLDLTRDGSHWRVTKMTTVTSLDLTPKL